RDSVVHAGLLACAVLLRGHFAADRGGGGDGLHRADPGPPGEPPVRKFVEKGQSAPQLSKLPGLDLGRPGVPGPRYFPVMGIHVTLARLPRELGIRRTTRWRASQVSICRSRSSYGSACKAFTASAAAMQGRFAPLPAWHRKTRSRR